MTHPVLRATIVLLAGLMPAAALADTTGRTCVFDQVQHCTPAGLGAQDFIQAGDEGCGQADTRFTITHLPLTMHNGAAEIRIGDKGTPAYARVAKFGDYRFVLDGAQFILNFKAEPASLLVMQATKGGASTVLVLGGRCTDTSIDEEKFLKNLDAQPK